MWPVIILLGGVAAYSLWPRGGLVPRASTRPSNSPLPMRPMSICGNRSTTGRPIRWERSSSIRRRTFSTWSGRACPRYATASASAPNASRWPASSRSSRKEEWPGWKQPPQQSAGAGDDRTKNPLGARVLYLNTDNRIHAHERPVMIGTTGTGRLYPARQRRRDLSLRPNAAGKPRGRIELAEPSGVPVTSAYDQADMAVLMN